MATELVNEDTTSYLTITFLGKDGLPAIPASVQYRVDCLSNGRELRDWTVFTGTLASTIELTMSPSDNAILTAANRTERRIVQIAATYGSGDQYHGEFNYDVDNLREPIVPIVVRGDDYNDADGRAFKFTGGLGWPDLTSASVLLTAQSTNVPTTLSKSATVETATGANKVVRVELTAAETLALDAASAYRYKLTATLTSGRKTTLISGTLSVVER